MRDLPLCILLVEDSATYSELVRQALEPAFVNLTIIPADSLMTARQYLKTAIPDLMLLDLHLPDGKGTDLLQEYQINPLFPTILLITDHGDEKAAFASIRAGASDFLSKTPESLQKLPFTVERSLREWQHVVERRKAEASLQNSEKQYQLLFSNMMEAVAIDELITDANGKPIDWRIVDVNPAYEKLTQRSRSQIVGRRASRFYGDKFDRRPILKIFGRIQAGDPPVRTELYVPYLEMHLQISIFPLESGKFATLSQDISKRKHAEAEREQILAELDGTINAIADALVIYRPDGSIARMNPAAQKLLEYTPEISQKSYKERFTHLQVETIDGKPYPLEQTLQRVFRGETFRGFIGVLRKADGESIWLSNSAAPIRAADGSLLGAVGIATDVSTLRELEAQRELYVHSISHDLRTPLTTIQGHTELLQSALKGAKTDDSVQTSITSILSAVENMRMMLEDLLDTALFEGGNLNLNRQPLHLASFIDQLRQSIFCLLDESRLTITIEPDLPLILADAGRLERILMNLLTNAQKYSAAGEPIKLGIARAKGGICFQVCDRGSGISPEDQPHVFERFYPVGGTYRPDKVGLGLYIVKMLVEAHAGEVKVDSAPGQGSCFSFTLPIEPVPASEQ